MLEYALKKETLGHFNNPHPSQIKTQGSGPLIFEASFTYMAQTLLFQEGEVIHFYICPDPFSDLTPVMLNAP